MLFALRCKMETLQSEGTTHRQLVRVLCHPLPGSCFPASRVLGEGRTREELCTVQSHVWVSKCRDLWRIDSP